MDPTRRLLNLLTASALIASCGCSAGRVPPRVSPPSETPPVLAPVTPATAYPPVQPAPDSTHGWAYWQVDEGEADTVLVAVIRSARGTRKHDVPLKRYPPREQPGEIVVESTGITHGFLPSGGTICVHDSFAVADDPSPGVTIRLSSVRGGFLRLVSSAGDFRKRLTVPVGRPSEHRLSEDAALIISFRDPRHVPNAPHVEPEWEQELVREREDRATVPLPPPWGAD
jgi:hypothetical protein